MDLFLVGDEDVPIKEKPTELREWIWALFDGVAGSTYESQQVRTLNNILQAVVQLAIMTSVVVMIIESVHGLVSEDHTFLVESVCIGIFSVELIFRIISTPNLSAFAASPWTWIDILAIAPYFLNLSGALPDGSGAKGLVVLRLLRLTRLARIVRVFKMGRKFRSVQIMAVAFNRARMAMVMLCVLMLMTIVLFSSLMYYVEREDAEFDPARRRWVRKLSSSYKDKGKQIFFQSIPDTMWWGLATTTTVGYGDVYPVTESGKAVAAACMVTGVLVIAYPITILTNAFATVMVEFADTDAQSARRTDLDKRVQQMNLDANQQSCPDGPPPPPDLSDCIMMPGGLPDAVDAVTTSHAVPSLDAQLLDTAHTEVQDADTMHALGRRVTSPQGSPDHWEGMKSPPPLPSRPVVPPPGVPPASDQDALESSENSETSGRRKRCRPRQRKEWWEEEVEQITQMMLARELFLRDRLERAERERAAEREALLQRVADLEAICAKLPDRGKPADADE
eukprot:Hpha_TRINITY_DN14682_c0_g4::TRINITY_DN14682_c0_g4_i1::g.48238::m.48238/K04874/KCNA1; potassium voltage-gated channel Shaker-related subfamily A member 1